MILLGINRLCNHLSCTHCAWKRNNECLDSVPAEGHQCTPHCKWPNGSPQNEEAFSSLCKQFGPAWPCTALQNTQRLEHLLLSSNIKETKEISKAINQSSQAVAQCVGWRSFCIVLYLWSLRVVFVQRLWRAFFLPHDSSTEAWDADRDTGELHLNCAFIVCQPGKKLTWRKNKHNMICSPFEENIRLTSELCTVFFMYRIWDCLLIWLANEQISKLTLPWYIPLSWYIHG